MPTFFFIEGVKICLFFDDHTPPHFHAFIAEYEAVIEISSVEILKGDLPKNKKRMILKWAASNKEELMEIWFDLNK
ncbi:MAG: DUF4160 domain-containing protein [Saprospiraceae bacterium]|nr:DUF4160 domain-containing protein [Saprospiraceae bacterium]